MTGDIVSQTIRRSSIKTIGLPKKMHKLTPLTSAAVHQPVFQVLGNSQQTLSCALCENGTKHLLATAEQVHFKLYKELDSPAVGLIFS